MSDFVAGYYYIAYAGADGNLHLSISETIVNGMSNDLTVQIAGAGTSMQPAPVALVTGQTIAPAVGSCAGALVIVAPVPAQDAQEQVALASFVSTDRGATFTGPYLLPGGPPYAGTSAALVSAPNGETLCFFCDASMKVRVCSSTDGIGWSDPGAVPNALSKLTSGAVLLQQGIYTIHPSRSLTQLYASLGTVPGS